MKKILFLILFLSFHFSLFAQVSKEDSLLYKVNYYKSRYAVKCLDEKITDNYGNGYNSLYGTRNMKTVLFGIAYRGGANNYYHKSNKRDNHNPLPDDALANLADEGFSSAVYLYSKNFSKAEHIILSSNKKDTLRYYQISSNDRKSMKTILLMVAEILDISDKGPVYLHCWNGWHQSGYIAAAILMQFCNYTNQMAYDYWVENTDGASKGYENVKERIMSFEPFSDIKIDENIKEMICPCINNK